MGCSKNYIMYWGGFYDIYNTMGQQISVHKVHKNAYLFLDILYMRIFAAMILCCKKCLKLVSLHLFLL